MYESTKEKYLTLNYAAIVAVCSADDVHNIHSPDIPMFEHLWLILNEAAHKKSMWNNCAWCNNQFYVCDSRLCSNHA